VRGYREGCALSPSQRQGSVGPLRVKPPPGRGDLHERNGIITRIREGYSLITAGADRHTPEIEARWVITEGSGR